MQKGEESAANRLANFQAVCCPFLSLMVVGGCKVRLGPVIIIYSANTHTCYTRLSRFYVDSLVRCIVHGDWSLFSAKNKKFSEEKLCDSLSLVLVSESA